MRLCVLGSSHVASLRAGWELAAEQFPRDEVVFFASVGDGIKRLKVENGKLISDDPVVSKSMAFTSGGLKEIDPAQFDAFLIYGVRLVLPLLERALSMAVVREILHQVVAGGASQVLLHKLQKLSGKPVWVAPCPLETPGPGDGAAKVRGQDLHPYPLLAQEMARALNLAPQYMLLQPPETYGEDLRSLERFGKGSVRLWPASGGKAVEHHPAHDVRHMNGDYGRLWLLANLPRIKQGLGQ